MKPSIRKLLRRTGRKLFFSRWLSETITFYFYAFFIATGGILVDRIAGELQLWTPVSLERTILLTVLSTLLLGIIYGAFVAWRDRRTPRELAWIIDQKENTDDLFMTALESEEVRLDPSWQSMIERKAEEHTEPLIRRNLIQLPKLGIRWLFILALLIDLFLLVMLSPVSSPSNQTSSPTPQQTSRSSDERGERKNGTSQTSKKDAKTDHGGSQSENTSSDSKNNKSSNSDHSSSSPSSDQNPKQKDAPLFGEKERHPHQRIKEQVKTRSTDGPLREGLVRIYETDRRSNKGETFEPSESSGSEDETGGNERQKVEAVYKSYQRQAERMIRNRSLPRDQRTLIRKYFEALRPATEPSPESSPDDPSSSN